MADLVEAGAMGVVHGAAGLGKTFAVETALAGQADVSVCWAAFPSRPTMRLRRLHDIEAATSSAQSVLDNARGLPTQ